MFRYSKKFSVGLTGGIGCGKTTVSDYFQKLGAGVIDADEVSRSLTDDNQPAVALIAQAFGKQVLTKPGRLDRSALREIVFNDASKKHELEQILHPIIRKDMQQLAQCANEPYLIFSIPLLLESHQQTAFDRILVVDATDEKRIGWIKKRSGLDETEIRRIMASQVARSERLEAADDVIHNNAELQDIYPQVEALHHYYLKLVSRIDGEQSK